MKLNIDAGNDCLCPRDDVAGNGRDSGPLEVVLTFCTCITDALSGRSQLDKEMW
jgi:hypothetical protein